MGFFSSKQYDALNEAGKVWTKTVGKHNVDEKIKECIVADDALRAAWIVKKFKNDSFSFKTNFVDQCLNFKSFNCLQFYIDTVAFNLTPSVDGDKELVLRMFLTAAHKKDNGLWQYLETKNGNTGFPDKTKIINQVFKAAWLEKASEYLIIEDTLDHALYLDALKLWPKDEHETFSELLAFAQKLSPAYLHEVLDSALYDAVSKGYKTRAETLIDAGANVNLVYDKRPVACILRAAMNEDPQMIDLLIESGAKMDEVGPYLMEEVRAQKPFSPIIGHLKKYIKAEEPEDPDMQSVEGYSLADPETLMHRQVLPGTDITLTTMFNFARRQQTIVTRAGESLSAETKDFDDILSAESVIILSEKFKEFGGAPEKLLPMLQKSPMPGLAVSPGGKP